MMFEPFTPAHFAGILLTVIAAAGIIGFRRTLKSPRTDRAVRFGLAGVLVTSEISLYVWYSATDNWGLHAFPFQLCTMTLWLSVAMLLTRNRRLYEVAFFLGILGAAQAVATPNLDETFPGFRYFHFFIAHAAIIASAVYMTAAAGFRPGIGSAGRAWIWLNVLAVPAAVANHFTGENYMFLARKPETPSLLDLLAPWPWYILQLELVALTLCLLLLGIVKASDRWFAQESGGTKKNKEVYSR